MKYLTHFTLNTPYEAEARELQETASAFGLTVEAHGVESRGSWQENVRARMDLIREALWRGRPVAYLDADARIRQSPNLLSTIPPDVDFAAHWREGRELLCGTMYWGATSRALELLDAWYEENATYPDVWDQKNLQRILERNPGKWNVQRLPAAYCQIFDIMADAGEPVIEHMQASRRFRRSVGA